jgi:hypothetical protein
MCNRFGSPGGMCKEIASEGGCHVRSIESAAPRCEFSVKRTLLASRPVLRPLISDPISGALKQLDEASDNKRYGSFKYQKPDLRAPFKASLSKRHYYM